MKPYFRGEKLFGDDFTSPQIRDWMADEASAYSELGKGDHERGYPYHAVNWRYGFRFLPSRVFDHALGFGSAFGDEFKPIISQVREITIVEPCQAFWSNEIARHPVKYVLPGADGALPFGDNQFDLVTCLGVLHHIPNVSYVVTELFRCLRPSGWMVLREPTVSMGDWRKIRRGVTSRERGVPVRLMHKILVTAGFQIQREQRCMFSVTGPVGNWLGCEPFNSKRVLVLDELLCALFSWNECYHPVTSIQKLSPVSVFFVLRKPPCPGVENPEAR